MGLNLQSCGPLLLSKHSRMLRISSSIPLDQAVTYTELDARIEMEAVALKVCTSSWNLLSSPYVWPLQYSAFWGFPSISSKLLFCIQKVYRVQRELSLLQNCLKLHTDSRGFSSLTYQCHHVTSALPSNKEGAATFKSAIFNYSPMSLFLTFTLKVCQPWVAHTLFCCWQQEGNDVVRHSRRLNGNLLITETLAPALNCSANRLLEL